MRSKESDPLIKLHSDKEIQDGTATRKIKEYLGYLRSLETLALQFSNKPRTLETVVSEHKYTDIDLSTNPAEFYKQQLETARKIYPSNPLVKEYSEEEIKSGKAAEELRSWQYIVDVRKIPGLDNNFVNTALKKNLTNTPQDFFIPLGICGIAVVYLRYSDYCKNTKDRLARE